MSLLFFFFFLIYTVFLVLKATGRHALHFVTTIRKEGNKLAARASSQNSPGGTKGKFYN